MVPLILLNIGERVDDPSAELQVCWPFPQLAPALERPFGHIPALRELSLVEVCMHRQCSVVLRSGARGHTGEIGVLSAGSPR